MPSFTKEDTPDLHQCTGRDTQPLHMFLFFCTFLLQTNMEGLTSLGHVQGCLFPNTSVGSSDEDCFPFQPGLAPTHSSCHPSAEGQHAYPWQKKIFMLWTECKRMFWRLFIWPFTTFYSYVYSKPNQAATCSYIFLEFHTYEQSPMISFHYHIKYPTKCAS